MKNVSFITAGAMVGLIVGFLTRPTSMLVGQLDLYTVLTRGAYLTGWNALFISLAVESFNHMVLIGFIGAAIGAVIGAVTTDTTAPDRSDPTPPLGSGPTI